MRFRQTLPIPQQTLSLCRSVDMPALNLPLCRLKAMLALPFFPNHLTRPNRFTRIRPRNNLNHISHPMSTQNRPTRQSPYSTLHPTHPNILLNLAIRHIPHHAHKPPNQGGELSPQEKRQKKAKLLNLNAHPQTSSATIPSSTPYSLGSEPTNSNHY